MSGNETPMRGHIQINNVSKIYDPDGAKVLADMRQAASSHAGMVEFFKSHVQPVLIKRGTREDLTPTEQVLVKFGDMIEDDMPLTDLVK